MSRLRKTKAFAVKLKDSQKLEHSSSGGAFIIKKSQIILNIFLLPVDVYVSNWFMPTISLISKV